MSASDRLRAELARGPSGDWILLVEGLSVAAIIWDDGLAEEPTLVVWDQGGQSAGRVFSLKRLFPDMRLRR